MLSHIIYSLSFKMVCIVYLGQKGGGRAPCPPSKSATGNTPLQYFTVFFQVVYKYVGRRLCLDSKIKRARLLRFRKTIESQLGYSVCKTSDDLDHQCSTVKKGTLSSIYIV